MHHQLIIENLACQRGDKVLFHHLNLQIQAGDFVQIEGHNGIGKTSLLRIVAGLAVPLEGKVRWNSEEIFKQREVFNYDLLYLGHQSGIKRVGESAFLSADQPLPSRGRYSVECVANRWVVGT